MSANRAAHKAAAGLQAGDWFIDPRREGRRPAQVVGITGVFDDRVHVTLDDHRVGLGAWAASYRLDEVLELTGDPR